MNVKIKNSRVRWAIDLLKKHARARGLKWTQQRELIASTFFGHGSHMSAEQLHEAVKKRDAKVGYSTVYRTLKLIVSAGLGSVKTFREQKALFEPEAAGEHHDHIVCLRCGKILEFENPSIERLQRQVARDKDFEIRDHRLVLYGYCSSCRPDLQAVEKDLVSKMSLAQMESGASGIVVRVSGGKGMRARLESLGLRVGAEVRKVSAQLLKGPVTIQVGGTQLAIGFGVAQKVFVEVPE